MWLLFCMKIIVDSSGTVGADDDPFTLEAGGTAAGRLWGRYHSGTLLDAVLCEEKESVRAAAWVLMGHTFRSSLRRIVFFPHSCKPTTRYREASR